MTKHLIFDTETTGLILNSKQPHERQPSIIEYFGLMLEEKDGVFVEIGKLHLYFDPGKPIPKVVQKITGITPEMLKGKPTFKAACLPILHQFTDADVMVAHNLSFDRRILSIEFDRAQMTTNWPPSVCTVESTEHFRGHRLSLTALHQILFEESFANAHSAENDVRALARCYIELHKRGEV